METFDSTSTDNTKAAGIAGWIFLMAVIVSNALRGAPVANDAPIGDIVTSYRDNTLIPISHSLYILNIPALLLYAAGIFRRIRSDGSDIWARAGLGGAAILLLSFALVVTSDVVVTELVRLSPDAGATIMGFFKLHAAAFVVNAAILGTVMICFAMGARKNNTFPGWLTILGLIGGALLLVSAFPIDAIVGGSMVGMIGFGGFILWLVWVGVTSTKMLKG